MYLALQPITWTDGWKDGCMNKCRTPLLWFCCTTSCVTCCKTCWLLYNLLWSCGGLAVRQVVQLVVWTSVVDFCWLSMCCRLKQWSMGMPHHFDLLWICRTACCYNMLYNMCTTNYELLFPFYFYQFSLTSEFWLRVINYTALLVYTVHYVHTLELHNIVEYRLRQNFQEKNNCTYLSKNTYFNATVTHCSRQLTVTRVHCQNQAETDKIPLTLCCTIVQCSLPAALRLDMSLSVFRRRLKT